MLRQDFDEAGYQASNFATGPSQTMKPDLSIERNFLERGLSVPRLLCADAASLPGSLNKLTDTSPSGEGDSEAYAMFDAIITDPPYGKREWLGGSINGLAFPIEPVAASNSLSGPSSVSPLGSLSTLRERIDSLLGLGARCLKPGGRLVFFLPVDADLVLPGDHTSIVAPDALGEDASTTNRENFGAVAFTSPENLPGAALDDAVRRFLPSHPSLEVVSVGRDDLNDRLHRLLVTMRRRDTSELQDNDMNSLSGGKDNDLDRKPNNDLRRWHWASS
jgi:hypothetical protein